MQDLISIIVPAYNEEGGIRRTVERVKKVKFGEKSEIIVVDDGSSDRTYENAKKIKGIRILKHRVNKGKAAALRTGFSAAKGDAVATIDADCTYPPEQLPKMLKLIRSEKADVVLGSRFYHKKRGVSIIFGAGKKVLSAIAGAKSDDYTNFYGNALFSSLITVLTGRPITDGSTGLRVFRKKILDGMRIKSRGLDWEVEMTTRSLTAGLNVVEIPINYYPRVGRTKLKILKDGLGFLVGIVRGRFF
ncbi:MAG: glycosyltransferase family 2 protein [Candidatus Aenigmarchaeota archaeon]|nr:glycosyltransferase family 2 protein [Candidatus Aenigmarchaeota archaeon]